MAIDPNQLPKGGFLLFAEGNSEEGLLKAALRQLGRVDATVLNIRGINRFKTVLQSYFGGTEQPDLGGIGILFDAEQAGYAARLTSLCDILARFGIDVDRPAIEAGSISTGGTYRVGIFVSPDNRSPGRIEQLVLQEVRSSDVAQCVDQLAECWLGAAGKAIDEKGLAQVYISGRSGDVCGIGTAFDKGTLDIANGAYSGIVRMVSDLMS
jgi:hypothetical protein